MYQRLTDQLAINAPGQYVHYCPNCKWTHEIHTEPPYRNNGRWTFNGNIFQPTFYPDIRLTVGAYTDEDTGEYLPRSTVCHYYLTDGYLYYQNDFDGAYSGKTLALPVIPAKHYNGIRLIV